MISGLGKVIVQSQDNTVHVLQCTCDQQLHYWLAGTCTASKNDVRDCIRAICIIVQDTLVKIMVTAGKSVAGHRWNFFSSFICNCCSLWEWHSVCLVTTTFCCLHACAPCILTHVSCTAWLHCVFFKPLHNAWSPLKGYSLHLVLGILASAGSLYLMTTPCVSMEIRKGVTNTVHTCTCMCVEVRSWGHTPLGLHTHAGMVLSW